MEAREGSVVGIKDNAGPVEEGQKDPLSSTSSGDSSEIVGVFWVAGNEACSCWGSVFSEGTIF